MPVFLSAGSEFDWKVGRTGTDYDLWHSDAGGVIGTSIPWGVPGSANATLQSWRVVAQHSDTQDAYPKNAFAA